MEVKGLDDVSVDDNNNSVTCDEEKRVAIKSTIVRDEIDHSKSTEHCMNDKSLQIYLRAVCKNMILSRNKRVQHTKEQVREKLQTNFCSLVKEIVTEQLG